MDTNQIVRSALAGLLTLGLAASATQALAEKGDTEKCAGIVKAGHNDCGTTKVGCHGSIKKNNDKEAWIEVPAGTCEKITGGKVTDKPWNAPGGLAEYNKTKNKG